MTKLAVLILTYNEEQHIKDCIMSAQFADEIIVIDSGSTDSTVEIAENAGAKVIYHPFDEGFAAQRNFALEQTTAQWVMFLDADERITEELAQEIKQVIDSEPVAYAMPRKNVAFGHWLQYGGWYPDYCLRIYPRTAVSWDGIVHESPNVNVPKKKLTGALIHYTYNDWDRYFAKFNSYTTLMARKNLNNGKLANFADIIFRPSFAFFKMYILKNGWRDGKMGFIMAWYHFFYTMAKYVKLYYMQRDKGVRL